MLAIPADHPLAKHEKIQDADLNGLQMLSLGPDYLLHDQIAAICEEHGAELMRAYEGTSLDALRQMVSMGMGATFLPQLYVSSEIVPRDGAVVTRPMARSVISRSIGLVWRKGSGAHVVYDRIAAEILEVVRKNFGGLVRIET